MKPPRDIAELTPDPDVDQILTDAVREATHAVARKRRQRTAYNTLAAWRDGYTALDVILREPDVTLSNVQDPEYPTTVRIPRRLHIPGHSRGPLNSHARGVRYDLRRLTEDDVERLRDVAWRNDDD